MTYIIEDGLIYKRDNSSTILVGLEVYTVTTRLNENTVEDVTFQFSLNQGQYFEKSRTKRYEPISQAEQIPDKKFEALENEASLLGLKLINTQTRLQQSENDHAALLLELVDKGVL
jgi:hypothetical protein